MARRSLLRGDGIESNKCEASLVYEYMQIQQRALNTCVLSSPLFSVQAMARVWRDGQKKTVHIYRLLTAGKNT